MTQQNASKALSSPLNSAGSQITLPSPPPTLPPWAKVLWYLAEGVAVGISWKLYDYGASIIGAGGTDAPDEWRRFVAHFSDTVSASPADDQQFTVDVVNYTNGNIDSSWTQGDYDLVTAAFDNFGPSFMPHVSNRMVWDRVDAYRMAFNAYSNSKPFAESGPPDYSRAYAVTGGDPQAIPPQSCTTITERTLTRANWGRMYLPSFGANAWAGSGRLGGNNMNAIAQGYHDFVVTLGQAELFVVVPATSVQKSPLRALQGIQAVSVDDVPDVQRRRRFKEALSHAILPVTALTQPAGQG